MLSNKSGLASSINIIQACLKNSQQQCPGALTFRLLHVSYISLRTHDETRLAQRRPISHGQNLSNRYIRLENSLRGKTGYLSELNDLATSLASGGYQPADGIKEPVASSSRVGKTMQKIFMGLVIPEKPTPPADDECCMSGCAICVYDLYDDAMSTYKDTCKTVCDELLARDVDEETWPRELHSFRSGQGLNASSQEIIIDPVKAAFEKMERELQSRRASQMKDNTGNLGKEAGSMGKDGATHLLTELARPSGHQQTRQFSTTTSLLSISSLSRESDVSRAKSDKNIHSCTTSPPNSMDKLPYHSSRQPAHQSPQQKVRRRRKRRRSLSQVARDVYEAATWWLFSR